MVSASMSSGVASPGECSPRLPMMSATKLAPIANSCSSSASSNRGATGDGDDILTDKGDTIARLRDGIYVIRVEDALIVKRIAVNPVSRRATVQSDNPAYPDWPDLALSDVNCIGRVIWAARKVV